METETWIVFNQDRTYSRDNKNNVTADKNNYGKILDELDILVPWTAMVRSYSRYRFGFGLRYVWFLF